MDKQGGTLERRLREEAREIHAQVSPQLEARIRHSLRRSGTAPERRRGLSWPLWLAASLSGAAVAVVAVVAVTLNQLNDRAESPPDAVAYSVPEYVRELQRQFPLRAETADLTGPLDEELEKLRADIERARETVEEDLRFTF